MANERSTAEDLLLIIGAAVAIPLGLVAIGAPLVLIKAFVLMRLWSWYIAPLIGVPLDMVHSFGVVLVCGFILARVEKDSGKEGDWKRSVPIAICGPLLTLLAGWIGTFWL